MSTRSSLQNPSYPSGTTLASPSLPISTAASAATSSSSLLTPTLAHLADPPTRYLDAAALDYLIIEMTHTLRASTAVATERMRNLEREMREAGILPPAVEKEKGTGKDKESALKKEQRESSASLGSLTPGSVRGDVSAGASPGPGSEREDDEEGLRLRLEAIGVHVGGNIAERLCRDRPRFSDTLDAVKFVCKDVWSTCWDKQVDNLRTNHRGVYVLQDNQFKPISRISSSEGSQDAQRRAKIYVAMPAGIIKGALARMGYQASVTPEIPHLPQCTFQVKLPRGS